MPTGLFVPSPLHDRSAPRVDDAADIYDVLAAVALHHGGRETRLVIGLDIGRVIRCVELPAELSARARVQLDAHERKRPWQVIRAAELYVLDVQAVEKQPDTPGADDPLFLYGVLRGPYPHGLRDGVAGIEGQLATTRGEVLDGLAHGIQSAFHYDSGRCGTSCVHAALPIDAGDGPCAVLAFPLVPMGDDGTNELVAAQLVCDVLGAMRADLGDDLGNDPVPVPNRAQYERELAAAGWTVKGDVAMNMAGKGRLASLFAPSKKQKLPREATLGEYVSLIHAGLARLPGWPEPARSRLHGRIGVVVPRPRIPTPPLPGVGFAPQLPSPPRQVPAPPPPPPPTARNRPGTNPGVAAPRHAAPPPPPPPFTPRNRRPTPPPASSQRKSKPRTVMPGLTSPTPKEWIRQFIDDHTPPDRSKRTRVVTPDRATGASAPDWMTDLIETEFPDDDK